MIWKMFLRRECVIDIAPRPSNPFGMRTPPRPTQVGTGSSIPNKEIQRAPTDTTRSGDALPTWRSSSIRCRNRSWETSHRPRRSVRSGRSCELCVASSFPAFAWLTACGLFSVPLPASSSATHPPFHRNTRVRATIGPSTSRPPPPPPPPRNGCSLSAVV